MRPDAILRFFRQRLGWLLCLALLLPMAQAATAAHAVTHGSEAGRGADAKAHLQHCPICTAAAVLGANAVPGTPAHLVLAAAGRIAPAADACVARVLGLSTARLLSEALAARDIVLRTDIDLLDEVWSGRPGLPANRGPPRAFT